MKKWAQSPVLLPPSLHYSSLPAERDERRRETCLEAGTEAGPGRELAGLVRPKGWLFEKPIKWKKVLGSGRSLGHEVKHIVKGKVARESDSSDWEVKEKL